MSSDAWLLLLGCSRQRHGIRPGAAPELIASAISMTTGCDTSRGLRSAPMTITTGYVRVTSGDGELDAYAAVPASGTGPGVLVFQEIFGINDNMRGLADRLAEAGYVAVVPDMFWRIEPRFERKDESGFGDAIGM